MTSLNRHEFPEHGQEYQSIRQLREGFPFQHHSFPHWYGAQKLCTNKTQSIYRPHTSFIVHDSKRYRRYQYFRYLRHLWQSIDQNLHTLRWFFHSPSLGTLIPWRSRYQLGSGTCPLGMNRPSFIGQCSQRFEQKFQRIRGKQVKRRLQPSLCRIFLILNNKYFES